MKLTAKYAMVVLDLAGDDKPLIDVYPQPPEGSHQPRRIRPMTIEVSYAPDRGEDTAADWVARQVVVTGAPEEEREWKTFVRSAWVNEQLEHLPPELAGAVAEFVPGRLADVVVEVGESELTDQAVPEPAVVVPPRPESLP